MKKALLVSTVSRQFTLFDRDNISILQNLGYEVHCAANFQDATQALDQLGIERHHIDIQRSPLSVKNAKAFYQLMLLMRKEKFNLVHCHAPMGGIIGRISAALTKTGPIFYTAHGFHFYKGAPALNWLLFYSAEKVCSFVTDCLITINNEDNALARKKFKAKNISYVPGVGLDTKKIHDTTVNRSEKRKELNIPLDTTLILSVGELIKRKNHETIIKAIAELRSCNCVYAICGKGELEHHLRKVAEQYGVTDKVFFLGYRKDIYELLKATDIFALPSFQEGLPLALMEAMAAGLPVVCSKIRGNVDLIENGKGGYLVDPKEAVEFAQCLEEMVNDKELRLSMGTENFETVQQFDIKYVNREMEKLYCQ